MTRYEGIVKALYTLADDADIRAFMGVSEPVSDWIENMAAYVDRNEDDLGFDVLAEQLLKNWS